MSGSQDKASKQNELAKRKHRLRKLARTRRDSIDGQQHRELSEKICNIFTSSEQFRGAERIHCYLAFGSEVLSDRILAAAWQSGKTVCTPVVDSKKSGRMRHALISSTTQFTLNNLGIREPSPAAGESLRFIESADFRARDVVVLPLLAFDSNAVRLGYGGGFYDRFLEHCAALKLGLAFAVQEFAELPQADHDVKLDALVTEAGLHLFNSC